MKQAYNILFIALLLMRSNVFAVIIGSNNNVSKQSFFTFPAIDNDNMIRGFIVMNQGFALENTNTICEYNAFFPVQNKIQLNGGSLILKQDLFLQSVNTFTSLGHITANNENKQVTLSLSDQLKTFGHENDDTIYNFTSIRLVLNSNINFRAVLQFKGDCLIEGTGHTLDLNGGAKIMVGANTTLKIQDVVLSGVGNNNIECLDDTSVLCLHNVQWLQDNDTTFTIGAMQFSGDVIMGGQTDDDSPIFAYQTAKTSTILKESQLLLSSDFTFSYDPVNLASKNLLEFENKKAILTLDGAKLHATLTGLNLKTGKLKVIDNSTIAAETQTTTDTTTNVTTKIDNGITFGTGVDSEDLKIVIDSDLELACMQGSITYKNSKISSLEFSNEQSGITMYTNTKLQVFENIDTGIGRLIFKNNSTLAVAFGKSVVGTIVPLGKFNQVKFTP